MEAIDKKMEKCLMDEEPDAWLNVKLDVWLNAMTRRRMRTQKRSTQIENSKRPNPEVAHPKGPIHLGSRRSRLPYVRSFDGISINIGVGLRFDLCGF